MKNQSKKLNLNSQNLELSKTINEMRNNAEDLLNIATVFSARNNDLITYKKQLEKNLNEKNSKNKSKLLE